jgi:hypothetical protein
MPEYNSSFKTQVRELTITCVYDYNTVYRVCSVFGITKAKDILNMCYDVHIQYLLEQCWDFPSQMNYDEEEAARITLKYVDPNLPELFERLLESSEYNSETLYRVFMSHGFLAAEIIDYAIDNKLMPFQLLRYSEKKLSERAEESMNKLAEEIDNQPVIELNAINKKSKEEKLPRKLRNGW